jgi:hypothetical protein
LLFVPGYRFIVVSHSVILLFEFGNKLQLFTQLILQLCHKRD